MLRSPRGWVGRPGAYRAEPTSENMESRVFVSFLSMLVSPLNYLNVWKKDFGKFQQISDVSVREFLNILCHRALEGGNNGGGNDRIESSGETEKDEDGDFLWPFILPSRLVLMPNLGGSGL